MSSFKKFMEKETYIFHVSQIKNAMNEFLIISVVLIILFGVIRRFIFFNTFNAFNKAAQDFYKKQEEMEKRKKKGR